jgi:hypothetical protein
MTKRLLVALSALAFICLPACADEYIPSGAGPGGTLPTPGTLGNVLTSTGITWASEAPPSGTIPTTTVANQYLTYDGTSDTWTNGLSGQAVLTADASLTQASASTELIDTTTGAITATLPLASASGKKVFLFKVLNGTNSFGFALSGADTLDGGPVAGSQMIPAGWCAIIQSDGVSNWNIWNVFQGASTIGSYVYNNQNNVYQSGSLNDFTNATGLILPNVAGGSSGSTGTIVYDSLDNNLHYQGSMGDVTLLSSAPPNVVLNNQNNTYSTGTQDLTNATALILPSNTPASQAGSISFETLDSQVHFYDGTGIQNLFSSSSVIPIVNGGTQNGALSVAQGTVYYGDGTKLVGLAPGGNGEFLQTTGMSSNPQWAIAFYVAGTGLTTTGGTVSLVTPVSIAHGGTNNLSLNVSNGNILYTNGTQITSLAAGGAHTFLTGTTPPTFGNAFDTPGTGLVNSGSTISLVVPVTTANGGTHQTSWTAGALVAVDGTGNTLTSFGGNTGTIPIATSATGNWAAYYQLQSTGGNGAQAISANNTSLYAGGPGQFSFGGLSVTGTAVLTIANSGWVTMINTGLNVASGAVISITPTIPGGAGAASAGAFASIGVGPTPGHGSSGAAEMGGGGAGNGGAGGAGGGATGGGGQAGQATVLSRGLTGSGGGGGSAGTAGTGGAGGAGGGYVAFCGTNGITGGGVIRSNAQIGFDATTLGSGGGGGSGGVIAIYDTSGTAPSISLNAGGNKGGAGAGAAGFGGGGSAGGWVYYMGTGSTAGITTNVAGASGGAGTAGNGGTGASGQVVFVDELPLLPLIVMDHLNGAWRCMAALDRLKSNIFQGIDRNKNTFSGHTDVSFISALYTAPGNFRQLCMALHNGCSIPDLMSLITVPREEVEEAWGKVQGMPGGEAVMNETGMSCMEVGDIVDVNGKT